MSETIKIRNVSGWECSVRNPHIIFTPGQVVEVNYDLGSKLILQPEFIEVKEIKPQKKASKKKSKIGDE